MRVSDFKKKSNAFLSRNNGLYLQLLIVILLSFFSAASLAGVFMNQKALIGDRLCIYSYFYDMLHSLNVFGEISWWNPTVQNGFPQYYTSMLGLGYLNPLFVLIAIIVWIAGKIGIHITSFIRWDVFYFGVMEPTLFLFSVWFFARQIFKNKITVLYVLILSAFSVGIVTNLSEIDFSNTAFGLLFAACLLKYLDKSNEKNYLLLLLSFLVIAITASYYLLFWNILFIPAFLLFVYWHNREKFNEIFHKKKRIILGLVLVFICFVPNLLIYLHGKDITRKPAHEKVAEYFRLQPGNPIMFLTASVPSISYDNNTITPYDHNNKRIESELTYFDYIGIIGIPLILTGFVFSKSVWKNFFLLMTPLCALVVMLAGYSPLFSTLLFFNTPVRANSHWGDLSFFFGYFLLLIFSAGIGLDVIVSHYYNKILKLFLAVAFSIYSLAAVGLIFFTYQNPFSSYVTGFSFCLYLT